MPRYFFHTEDGYCLKDEDGTELRDFDQAKDEAVQLLCETLRNNSAMFWTQGKFKVIVSDDKGLLLLTLDMFATLTPVILRSPKSG